MKGCDYVSKSLSSPLLLPYLFVTKRRTEKWRTLTVTRDDELLYQDVSVSSAEIFKLFKMIQCLI